MSDSLRWRTVRPGDDYRAQNARDVADLAVENTLLPGRGYRLQRVPGRGTAIELDTVPAVWNHPWKVTLKGDRAEVRPGLINGDVPWIMEDDGSKRPMDGLDAEGEPDPKGPPKLRLSDGGPWNEEGRSWIVVLVFVDPETGARMPVEKDGLLLDQTGENTWDAGFSTVREYYDGRMCGAWPLAQLRRPKEETSGFGKLTQVSMFHLNHRFVGAGEGRQARHWFFV